MALRRWIISEKEECVYEDGYCSPPSPPPPSTRIQISNKNHVMTLVVVVVAAVLAVCLLSLAFYAAHRYRSSRRRRRAAAAWAPPPPPSDAGGDLLREDLLVGGGGGEVPYHVWYIKTAGLEQVVIGAITVCEYRKGEGLVEGTDCAVCLGDFAEGEPLRLLPKCSHAFHVPCIDTWLRSHVNCPLCRAPILAPAPPRPPPTSPLPSPAAGGINLGSEVAVVSQSTQQATAAGDSFAGGNSEEGGNSSAVLPPALVGVDHPALGASFSSEESEIWVPIDLGNGGLGDEIASCTAPVETDLPGELQPVRRSISMDSSALAGLLLRMRLAGSSRDGGRKPCAGEDATTNKKGRTGENNRKGATMLDAPLEMERCMSGGRFVLSRFSGRARCAILPL